MLSTIDLRLLQKQELDMPDLHVSYLFDCILACMDLSLNPTDEFINVNRELV